MAMYQPLSMVPTPPPPDFRWPSTRLDYAAAGSSDQQPTSIPLKMPCDWTLINYVSTLGKN